jgi:hypothetical protein
VNNGGCKVTELMFDNKRKSEIGPVKGREIKRYERYLETKAGIEYKNLKIYISK